MSFFKHLKIIESTLGDSIQNPNTRNVLLLYPVRETRFREDLFRHSHGKLYRNSPQFECLPGKHGVDRKGKI